MLGRQGAGIAAPVVYNTALGLMSTRMLWRALECAPRLRTCGTVLRMNARRSRVYYVYAYTTVLLHPQGDKIHR